MKLEARGYRQNGRREVEATLAVMGDDGSFLLEDIINLSRDRERRQFAQLLHGRLSIPEDRVEAQLLELLGQIHSALELSPGEESGQVEPRMAQADLLLKLVKESGSLLFRDDLGEAYAQVRSCGQEKIWRCRGRDFRRWLVRLFLEREAKVPYAEAITSALGAIESRIGSGSPEYPLFNRVALFDGAIYYDLADESGQMVKVTPGHWTIEANGPVPLFRRYAHQRPQVVPLSGGDPFMLTRFINLKDEVSRLLVVVYAIACLVPDIPHPILVVHGPGGAAKTTLCRMLRAVIDPSALPVISFPREERELIQKLSHHWFAPFDNVSTLPDWLQDCLCRASTGEGFSKRELYSDDEDIIYSFRRCVLLNGINIAATHSDLLRRCILLGLEEIAAEERRPEKLILAEFEQARPKILGGMFDVLSQALVYLPSVRLPELPSMADFALWGAAISRALGKGEGAFLQAYGANIQQQHAEAIESSLVASVLMRFMENRENWEGSPSQLYSALKTKAEELNISVSDRQWPRNPNWLVRSLNRVVPNLRAEGLTIECQRSHKKRTLTVFRKVTGDVVTAVMPSPQIGLEEKANVTTSPAMSSYLSSHVSQIGNDDNDSNDGILPSLSGHNSPAVPQQDGEWEEL